MTDLVSAQHPTVGSFQVRDGCLLIGGVTLTRLADRVGQTPFFVYDRARLTDRIRHLRECLPSTVALHYAIKANPMPAVVEHLSHLVNGFDVASARELQTALDTTMLATRISFAGPGKTEAELKQAIAADVTIAAESQGELRTIARLGDRAGLCPRVVLRVNPNFEVKGSGMRLGGGPQQFGVDAEQAPQVLHEIGRLGLNFVGLHIFAGSQNLRADILQQTQEQTIDLAVQLASHTPAPIRHLNIGGGFGIPYFPKDVPLDVAAIGEKSWAPPGAAPLARPASSEGHHRTWPLYRWRGGALRNKDPRSQGIPRPDLSGD